MLSEGLYSVCRQVKVEAVGTDLRGGYLSDSLKPEFINFLFNDINQPSGMKQHLVQPREIAREQSSGWGEDGRDSRADQDKKNPDKDAQQVLLKHAYPGEEMLVVPAALHVIKVHPESKQKLHTAGIQSDLLGPAEQGGPIPLIQHGEFQDLPGADSDQRGRQPHGSRTHDEHGDSSPPLSDAVQADFHHHIDGDCHQSAQSSVIGESAVLFLRVFRDAANSSVFCRQPVHSWSTNGIL
ncbi:hypothetical protein INR49_021588 [Caranx melampygus]|nr:hypothetical protein INR49_021588 [Caranx melampygus]